jgi:hypothetical protein
MKRVVFLMMMSLCMNSFSVEKESSKSTMSKLVIKDPTYTDYLKLGLIGSALSLLAWHEVC